MIKINLVREGRTVRGTGAAPGAAPVASSGGGPSNLNNILVGGLLVLGIVGAGPEDGGAVRATESFAGSQGSAEANGFLALRAV